MLSGTIIVFLVEQDEYQPVELKSPYDSSHIKVYGNEETCLYYDTCTVEYNRLEAVATKRCTNARYLHVSVYVTEQGKSCFISARSVLE